MMKADSAIQKDIQNELKWEPSVKETDIGVIVKDGVVTLTGSVPSYSDKLAAKRSAKRIAGVRAIVDEIEVSIPSPAATSDADIARHIAHVFDWSSQLAKNNIKAEVRKGVVTLSGDVDWQYQRNYAQQQVFAIKGVRFVINNVTIRQKPAAAEVKHDIEEALRRHANIESSKINVAVTAGTVTLNGVVDSYSDRDIAENAAWAAPGVINVIDNLHVS